MDSASDLSRLPDLAPGPALLAAPDGVILAANAAFLSALGIPASGEVVGRPLGAVLVSAGKGLLEEAARTGRASWEGRVTRGDGSGMEVALAASAVGGEEGKGGPVLVFATDVTASRRLERAAAILGT
ncbi:MAG: PAS domain-containing protein, partial [Thermoanaerobaculia bacterium]|nr:PAS domain-containing protein [Thermoanaerobaculia bacterium]